jgi:hypothetical protein
MMGRCRIEILDDDDKVVNTVDVDPINAEEAVNDQRVHSVATTPQTNKRTLVPQTLLHQWLGHRNTLTPLMANEDGIWIDTAIAKDEDSFCEFCRISTARKANRGHTLVETIDDLIRHSCQPSHVIDHCGIILSLIYINITDVTSRSFVQLGIRDKTADSVFEHNKSGLLTMALKRNLIYLCPRRHGFRLHECRTTSPLWKPTTGSVKNTEY